jgi:hypothetical protein
MMVRNEKRITTRIECLGEAKIASPGLKKSMGSVPDSFVSDDEGVLIDVSLRRVPEQLPRSLEEWPAGAFV